MQAETVKAMAGASKVMARQAKEMCVVKQCLPRAPTYLHLRRSGSRHKLLTPVLSATTLARGGADGIADVMDDVAETMAEQEEIGQALSEGFGLGGDVMDDVDLQDELAELEEGMLDDELAGLAPVPQMQPTGLQPVAQPAAAQPAAASAEDDEMAAMMEAMMVPG